MLPSDQPQFDFLIIGSGFGGSVSAMRLAQKGYSVLVLEQGKRFRAKDFPKSNWNIFKYFWAPLIRCFGIQQISLLKGVMVLHGAGVGGGSLVYANTLMKPKDTVFKDSSWPANEDWNKSLDPFYSEAKRMLGVTTNTLFGDSDLLLKDLSREMSAEQTFQPTEVGVFLGEPGIEVSDPYFGGEGPHRSGCIGCGGCMVGCRYNAKNTLDKNYLYFAEKYGAQILPETKATHIIPQSDGTYKVAVKNTTAFFPSKRTTIGARKVIVAAGVLGTVDLLFKNRDVLKTLPHISDQLGNVVRTNGESLLGSTSFDSHRDFSRGLAIGSAFHIDGDTALEPVRYPSGSGALRFLAVPLTSDGDKITRPLKLLGNMIVRLPKVLRLWTIRDWAKRSVILLVMQSIDSKMKLRLSGGKLKGEPDGAPLPSFLPIAQTAVKKMAKLMNGEPQNIFTEVLLRTPATAHILGGCRMANSPAKGVIDHKHEVFGHPGLYVCDGSVIPANLGVNPSLTITAIAERFCSFFETKK